MKKLLLLGFFVPFFVATVVHAEPDADIYITGDEIDCNSFGVTDGVVRMVPVFEINTYDCEPGYYLPADGLGCVECPSNSYCLGGDFAYDFSITQGVDECPGGGVSPSGSGSVGDCGRMLHIGNSTMYLGATKKTVPSLNFDLDKDGVADLFANMTLKDVPMSHDTTKMLKVSYNGDVYSVYDNTVNPSDY